MFNDLKFRLAVSADIAISLSDYRNRKVAADAARHMDFPCSVGLHLVGWLLWPQRQPTGRAVDGEPTAESMPDVAIITDWVATGSHRPLPGSGTPSRKDEG
jgi:hypothetical protein